MGKKVKVQLPVAPLPDLMRWWNAQGTQGLIIGGLAASLLGRPRATRDIDGLVLLDQSQWANFFGASAAHGFEPRLPDALDFANQSRVLLLRHQTTKIDLDIAFGDVRFEREAVARGVLTQVAGVTVPLPTPEDLIIMKAIAHRERDWLDIEGLLAAHPVLDVERINQWVRTISDSLDIPGIYDELQVRLRRRDRPKV